MRQITTNSIFLFILFFVYTSTSYSQWDWILQDPKPTTNDLNGISIADANTGTAVGISGTILHTINGGTTWTNQSSGTTGNLRGVSCVDANIGTVVGIGSGRPPSGLILRTTDGGTTWTNQSSGITHPLNAVSFTDANTGTAVGNDGTILCTKNGGATWISQSSATTEYLYGVSFIDANTGFAVGTNGSILHTTNGGSAWDLKTIPGSFGNHQFYGVCTINSNTCIAVGAQTNNIGMASPTIWRTTDGGSTWNSMLGAGNFPMAGDFIYGVYFTDANTGTVVGNEGSIVRTTDGGSTWTGQSFATTNWLGGVCFSDANTGTIVGQGGIILHTTTGGMTSIKHNSSLASPINFVLNQNYPNPFNSITVISFQLSQNSYTSLKIFDVIGREVVTLVSETLLAGTYTRRWNALNMPSGVYFYRLQAGTFTETKKLILLR